MIRPKPPARPRAPTPPSSSSGAPATNSMPRAMAHSSRVVPRSGSSITRAASSGLGAPRVSRPATVVTTPGIMAGGQAADGGLERRAPLGVVGELVLAGAGRGEQHGVARVGQAEPDGDGLADRGGPHHRPR